MKLHEFPEEYNELVSLVAREKHISESAVRRDYAIVRLLKNLSESPYADQCVFKGGTSLSKCYPNSIERFSEDIDLTFLGMDLSDKDCDRAIKKIEAAMTVDASTEKTGSERSNRSKSMYVWFDDPNDKIKLEIGSTVRPDPYLKKSFKTYIQEYLEAHGFLDDVAQYGLSSVELNVLGIERTFIDKLMSVKRHAICGTLAGKVRHIYDVKQLYSMPEVQTFLADTNELRRLMQLTKATDSYYLGKRNIPSEYDPTGAYNFNAWKDKLDDNVRSNYEKLHETLLYTDEKQNLDNAIETFEHIAKRLEQIGE